MNKKLFLYPLHNRNQSVSSHRMAEISQTQQNPQKHESSTQSTKNVPRDPIPTRYSLTSDLPSKSCKHTHMRPLLSPWLRIISLQILKTKSIQKHMYTFSDIRFSNKKHIISPMFMHCKPMPTSFIVPLSIHLLKTCFTLELGNKEIIKSSDGWLVNINYHVQLRRTRK